MIIVRIQIRLLTMVMNMRFQMGMSKNQQIDPRLEIINVSCQLNRI